ncbi:MAG: hypothetical protein K9K37_01370 [Desulfocapsa sp.]|nr:hypothetical protein [Desulfocapsa sp.]
MLIFYGSYCLDRKKKNPYREQMEKGKRMKAWCVGDSSTVTVFSNPVSNEGAAC